MAQLDPDIADLVAWSEEITPYDLRHVLTYARLLDAEKAQTDWREVAMVILLCDSIGDPEQARRCWESHLERARWVATTGYQNVIARASLYYRDGVSAEESDNHPAPYSD